MQKHGNTVWFLRCNNHICHVTNINAVFRPIYSPTCEIFLDKTGHLERHFSKCSERVENVTPKNIYHIRKTLFDMPDSFVLNRRKNKNSSKTLQYSTFNRFVFRERRLKVQEKTTWTRIHFPISVSFSSNLEEEPIFFCNADPHQLLASFNGALEGLVS